MDNKFIMELIAAVDASALTRLDIRNNDTRITIEKNMQMGTFALPLQTAPSEVVSPPAVPLVQTAHPEPEQAVPAGHLVLSPIVGTVYLAPAPGADMFVKPGSVVAEGDTLCIVEAMKTMNEIESDFAGEVVEVLVENGALVEYNQPLMVIR